MADENGSGTSSDSDDIVMMPMVPDEVDVDPMLLALLHTTSFLDFADDDIVEPDAATAILERVGLYVAQLSAERLEEIRDDLEVLAEHGEASGWPSALIEFVRDFLYACGLDDRDDDDDDDD